MKATTIREIIVSNYQQITRWVVEQNFDFEIIEIGELDWSNKSDALYVPVTFWAKDVDEDWADNFTNDLAWEDDEVTLNVRFAGHQAHWSLGNLILDVNYDQLDGAGIIRRLSSYEAIFESEPKNLAYLKRAEKFI